MVVRISYLRPLAAHSGLMMVAPCSAEFWLMPCCFSHSVTSSLVGWVALSSGSAVLQNSLAARLSKIRSFDMWLPATEALQGKGVLSKSLKSSGNLGNIGRAHLVASAGRKKRLRPYILSPIVASLGALKGKSPSRHARFIISSTQLISLLFGLLASGYSPQQKLINSLSDQEGHNLYFAKSDTATPRQSALSKRINRPAG